MWHRILLPPQQTRLCSQHAAQKTARKDCLDLQTAKFSQIMLMKFTTIQFPNKRQVYRLHMENLPEVSAGLMRRQHRIDSSSSQWQYQQRVGHGMGMGRTVLRSRDDVMITTVQWHWPLWHRLWLVKPLAFWRVSELEELAHISCTVYRCLWPSPHRGLPTSPSNPKRRGWPATLSFPSRCRSSLRTPPHPPVVHPKQLDMTCTGRLYVCCCSKVNFCK